ncbi:beta-1,3-galactosyltransferase 2-like [Xenopus tropicalis]|uniref:Hexosyltransferase n=1 Tax=Xenopus tropicalis TaxID=8364 RepID=A0A8J1JBK7_XENTR|nr:beta-1,3-galactosyltransferase 2-like [Xenopus tropicalis]
MATFTLIHTFDRGSLLFSIQHHLEVIMVGERTCWTYCKISVLTIFSFSTFYFFITRRDHFHISYSSSNPSELNEQLNPLEPNPQPSLSGLKPQPNPSEPKPQPTESPGLGLPLSTTRHPLTPPYPYPYKFLLNPQEKCQKQNPFLILLVIGESHDINSRLIIRETWGNESNYIDVAVVTVFLVGVSVTATDRVQEQLEEEMNIYGDLVQQDFTDTYYNLTLKTLMGMEWISKYCPDASYVMKIDNDMFLNVDYLVHHLLQPGLPVRQNYFTGYIVANTGPLRAKEYKWYVPKEVYPNDTYPPYCSGPGYAFSADMAKKIYHAAQTIRVVPMEDSFMGICLYEMKIPPTNPPPNIFNGHRINYDLCLFNKLITVHHYRGDELRDVWKDFWAKRSGCKD